MSTRKSHPQRRQKSLAAESIGVLRMLFEEWFERPFTEEEIRAAVREAAAPLHFALEVHARVAEGNGLNGRLNLTPGQLAYFTAISDTRAGRLTLAAMKILTGN